MLKTRLNSDFRRPNSCTKSLSLFGYDSLLNKIIKDSIPVATVPWLHTYFSGRDSALCRRNIFFLNLKNNIIDTVILFISNIMYLNSCSHSRGDRSSRLSLGPSANVENCSSHRAIMTSSSSESDESSELLESSLAIKSNTKAVSCRLIVSKVLS